jgi:hypothetical protein
MGARPRRPANASVYLDHSHLCSAFRARGGDPDVDPAYLDLARFLERSDEKIDLCLSFCHAVEIAGWSNNWAATWMPQWLDALSFVFVHPESHIVDLELDALLRTTASNDERIPDPFAPSLLTAHVRPFSPAETPDLLRSPTLASLVRSRDLSKFDPVKAFSRETRDLFRVDAERARENRVSDDYARSVFAGRLNDVIARDLRARAFLLGLPDDVAARASATFLSDPSVLPARRAMLDLHLHLRKRAGDRKRGSQGDCELQSAIADMTHAVCGLYCDIFSCDGEMHETAGRVRGRRRAHATLSTRSCGGPSKFVDRLRREIEAVNRLRTG